MVVTMPELSQRGLEFSAVVEMTHPQELFFEGAKETFDTSIATPGDAQSGEASARLYLPPADSRLTIEVGPPTDMKASPKTHKLPSIRNVLPW